ncbi:hypothetical protein TNCV_1711241 [Trichonephila clavipes]|nr:hypothetical protein TNCV_1711241 [Trichonephila clavipes]
MSSMDDRSGDRAGQSNNRKFPVNRGRSEHDVQCVVLHCLVGGVRLADLGDRPQLLEIRYQKCIDLRSNYHRPELETGLSFTHLSPKTSYQFCRSAHQSHRLSLAALSREAEVMAAVLTVHAAANVVAPYEWILYVLQTIPFPD